MENYLEGASEDKPQPAKKKKGHSGYEFEGENGFADFGGYMDAKISKLDQQYKASKDFEFKESDLFSGISIFVNGLTNPSAGELKLIMLRHGGTYHTYIQSFTKFVIATNLPDVKIRNHTTRIIVRPEWISKCLEENRIVDYSPYLLVTSRNQQQPRITFGLDSNSKSKDVPERDAVEEMEQKAAIPDEEDDLMKRLNVINATLLNDATNAFEGENNTNKKIEENPTKNQARTANDPNFLTEFYNNSRLHHISTLGAMFKQHISDLRENHSGDFPGRQSLLNNIPARMGVDEKVVTLIMHIDMDCFFVSVGLRKHPHLIGKPVAVTHSKGNAVKVRPGSDLTYEHKAFHERYGDKFSGPAEQLDRTQSLSEIASCSYEARAKGLKNGMFVGSALKLCPDLKTIPYDFEGYKEVAFTLYNTIAEYTLDIEAVSCDEMYVDLTSLVQSTGIPVMDFVSYVRSEIKARTGCPCSAGIGANRIQARMATKQAKPNGQYYLSPDEVISYFKDIQITDLPGVGRSTMFKIEKKGWKTCEDLQKVPLSLLQHELGKKFGETLQHLASGRDEKPLNFGQTRKSVSAEVNYGIRFKTIEELETFLQQLCLEVQNRLVEARRKGKCVTLKYMVRAPDAPVETAKFMGHGICDVVNKSQNLTDFTADAEVIKKAVLQLNNEMNIMAEELRGIGIQVTKLDEPVGSGEVKDSRLKEMFSKVQQKQKELGIDAGSSKEEIKKDVPPAAISKSTVKKLPPKSPVKRGRPKKGLKNLKTKDITELLRSGVDDVDQDVLNELPEEFRAEAIRSHRVLMKRYNSDTKITPTVGAALEGTSKSNGTKETFEVDQDFLAALPEDIRREVEEEMRSRRKTPVDVDKVPERSSKVVANEIISPENIFLQSNWRDVLEAWTQSGQEPEDYDNDVPVIVGYWKEFILARRVEEVYSHFRFYYRITKDHEDCAWHRIYNVISKEIQSTMLSVFQRKLAIHDQISCNKCRETTP